MFVWARLQYQRTYFLFEAIYLYIYFYQRRSVALQRSIGLPVSPRMSYRRVVQDCHCKPIPSFVCVSQRDGCSGMLLGSENRPSKPRTWKCCATRRADWADHQANNLWDAPWSSACYAYQNFAKRKQSRLLLNNQLGPRAAFDKPRVSIFRGIVASLLHGDRLIDICLLALAPRPRYHAIGLLLLVF